MKAIISKGNSKVKCLNVSLTPGKRGSCKGISCGDCERTCYAKKAYKQYPDTKIAWDNNWEMIQHKEERARFFYNIVNRLKTYRGKYFRWHVAGEIVDQDYLSWMEYVAEKFPKVKFLCFTKNYKLDYKGMPKNLKIKFSMFPTTLLRKVFICWQDGRESIPIAWYQDGREGRMPSNSYICPGEAKKDGVKCARDCNKCWHSNRDVVFMAHQ